MVRMGEGSFSSLSMSLIAPGFSCRWESLPLTGGIVETKEGKRSYRTYLRR